MNMQKLLQQAQEMQERMQQELSETVVEATVGGGLVTVKMTGHKSLAAVEIDPEILDPEDPTIVQDLIIAAVNEASRKVDEKLRGSLGAHAASLPGLF
ncbi:MAG: YbaB/EbfC family nucleoid-associated protein [Acidobacteriota bacterium]